MTRLGSYIAAISVFFSCLSLTAQEKPDTLTLRDTLAPKEYSQEYLDTVKIQKKFILNPYSMIGVEYGVAVNQMMFNPTMTQTTMVSPNSFGIYYIKYHCKMFGYMPYFGYKVGLRYTSQGYKFKANKETGAIQDIEGATQVKMDFVEVPMLAQFHYDLLHFKLMADLGIYGGYRLNIDRVGENVSESIKNSFLDTDRRFDYGLLGGVGFGIVFSPIEFHVNASVRWGWGTIYDPDYSSKYYYRYAYPFDIMINAGVYFQITRRNGKSKSQLKKEAWDAVYNNSTPLN